MAEGEDLSRVSACYSNTSQSRLLYAKLHLTRHIPADKQKLSDDYVDWRRMYD